MATFSFILYRSETDLRPGSEPARALVERLHAQAPDNAEVNALLERLKQPADASR